MAAEIGIDDGKLIECIKNYPIIYDKNHGEYRDKQSKVNSWVRIGQNMGIPEELCEQRWIILRNRYATELRHKKKRLSHKPYWKYTGSMSFLEEYISPRRTRSSFFIGKEKRTFTVEVKPKIECTSSNSSLPEILVTTESGHFNSSNNDVNNASPPKLRPIAPRPTVSATTPVARLVTIPSVSDSIISTGIQNNCNYQHNDCKGKQEIEDEDILFGKSIGHSLKSIKNKRTKLQVKSEILSILAQHAD